MSWQQPTWINPKNPLLPWLIWANITFLTMMATLPVTGGYIANSTMQGALQMSFDDMRWISVSFIMMLGIVVPLGVYLAEKIGYKILFFIGASIFFAGIGLTCIARNFTVLLVARMISGLGAGALFPLSVVILTQIFPKKTISVAVALYTGLGFGLGAALGYWIGGYCCQYLTWDATFQFTLFLGLPTLPLIALLHSETPPKKMAPFDYLGYIAFTLFIASLFLILNSVKAEWNTGGVRSPFIVTSICVAISSLIALGIIEAKGEHPLIHFALFQIKSFALGCITIFFIGAVIYSTQAFSVTLLDYDLRYEKMTIGLYLAPIGLVLGATSAIAALLMGKINIRYLNLFGMTLVVISCLASPDITLYSSKASYAWIWNVRLFGVGFVLGPATALALVDIPKEMAGAASILIIVLRQIGGTVGSLGVDLVTIIRTIFHRDRFGSQIDLSSPAFQGVVENLKSHFVQYQGVTPAEALHLAVSAVRSNGMVQAHVTAIADAFLLLGKAMAIITIFLFLELIYDISRRREQVGRSS